MIKRTICFSNPAYLSYKSGQLLIKLPEVETSDPITQESKTTSIKTVPVEDIGIVVLDNQQITITQGLLVALSENNAVVINCDFKHLPFSMLLPMATHSTYTEKLRFQLEASVPLKKNLWKQTVIAKINNQAALLDNRGKDASRLYYLSKQVKSGDSENCEGRAASYYWEELFCDIDTFKRQRFGEPPNNLLNYGYAILRGVVARSLVASGLLTAMGIHHRNKYNPYCLADDIMEPYRPFVDKIVLDIVKKYQNIDSLTTELKKELLQIPAIDICIEGQKSPLMVGMQRTTASLMQCFEKESQKLVFPELF